MQDKTNKLQDSVNITIHHSVISGKQCSFARVQRETAYIGNIIDKAIEMNPMMKRETLLFSAELLKNGILALLSSGKAVDILELGTMYIKPNGCIDGAEESLNAVPEMTVGFTPSEISVNAVKNVAIAANVTKKNVPSVTEIFNVKTRSFSDSLNAGYSVKLQGSKLKIAGDEEKCGVFFAPCDESGNYEKNAFESFVHIKESELISNTTTNLEFNLPENMEKGTYRLIVATSYHSGKLCGKQVRLGEYENIVTIC